MKLVEELGKDKEIQQLKKNIKKNIIKMHRLIIMISTRV